MHIMKHQQRLKVMFPHHHHHRFGANFCLPFQKTCLYELQIKRIITII